MQPHPQSPAHPRLRKPWWLIYGFGLGLVLIDLIFYYVPPVSFFIFDLLNRLFQLLYVSACLGAGILVARQTHRARSAMLTSLLVGLLFFLIEFILQGMRELGLDYVLFLSVPVACLGIFVGFLGGLIGRPAEKTRKTIGLFYAIGISLVDTIAVTLLAELFVGSYIGFTFFSDSAILIVDVSIMVLGSLCGLVAWIMVLVQYAQAQSWGYFTLTFFFSGIMVLVYLIVGAQPRQPALFMALSPGVSVPVAGAYPSLQPIPAPPLQPDAVSILQQRFARGEINAEMYNQMLATLTRPPANSPRQ